jgi:hypothetical protein
MALRRAPWQVGRAAGLSAVVALTLLSTAAAQVRFDAELAGQAILPAATFVELPSGVPAEFARSGRHASAAPAAATARRPWMALPLAGQPAQGFSGLRPVGDGSYWVLSDNGFGTRDNSADALLMIHRVRPDFRTGGVVIERTVFIRDPLRRLPFRIRLEQTRARYLTGADLDPESIEITDDGIWLGDEFGPYLVKLDHDGRIQKLVTTRLDGRAVRSPDHQLPRASTAPPERRPLEIRRSAGLEGLTANADGTRLYAMLERPLSGADGIGDDGFIRLLEFDAVQGRWTGRSLRYRLGAGASAIGDIEMIDRHRALVVERDDGEGDAALGCASGQLPPGCFPNPARVKRVYLIDLDATSPDGSVRKIGYVDLLAIRDPARRARQSGDADPAPDAPFKFPFVTVESVARVDAEHIIVVNDNNLPFSAGRFLDRADDSEFILLRVPDLLNAR